MSRSNITVKDWKRAVYASRDPKMTGAVKVLCIYLSDHMSADRKVSVPRVKIAGALGCHQQRIAERLRSATTAGFLVSVQRGYPGRTAVYQGTWPDAGMQEMGTAPQEAISSCPAVPINEPDQRKHANMRTALLDAITTADLLERPQHRDDQERNNEEVVGRPAPSCLTDCVGNPFGCRDDCSVSAANRQRTA